MLGTQPLQLLDVADRDHDLVSDSNASTHCWQIASQVVLSTNQVTQLIARASLELRYGRDLPHPLAGVAMNQRFGTLVPVQTSVGTSTDPQ